MTSIKNVLKFIVRFFANTMPFNVNSARILAWKNYLDKTYPPGPWLPIDGFNTITKLNFDSDGNAIFEGNSGYPLKAFVNTKTGEVKTFDARRFYAS